MRPKEIQERLNISADKIKLYKREGIFSPQRQNDKNKTTDYTETDFENLRTLVVLNKVGFTSSDIRKMQKGEASLKEIGKIRMNTLYGEIERKKNSLDLLSIILNSNTEFDSFDTEHYYNIIQKREAVGDKFIDIENYNSISFIRNVKCIHCGSNLNIDLEDYLYSNYSFEKDNGMGPDIVYEFDSEKNCNCPNCSKKIRIYGWIREYPIGCYDSEDIKCDDIEE